MPLHFLILSFSQKLPTFWKTVFVYVSHKQMQTKPKGTKCVPGPEETRVAQLGPQQPQGHLLHMQGETSNTGKVSPVPGMQGKV